MAEHPCQLRGVAMPLVNAEIAARLNEIADLLEIEAGNPFRIRAYRRAARLVGELPRPVSEMLEAGEDLAGLPGIGEDLAGKIAALARGEHLPMLDELERRTPPGITALLALPGLGPRRVRQLHETLGVDSLPGLAAALRAGSLRRVPGFGPGIEAALAKALAAGGQEPPRMRLALAEQIAASLLARLRAVRGVSRAEVAGSFRRRRETVGDLDIVVAATAPAPVIEAFVTHEDVREVAARGTTRATVRLRGGLQVDLRVVAPESFGAALCYFTGSKAHNIALRRIAGEAGLKLNEYGLFRGRGRIAGATEAEVYAALGLATVPPELREDRGEIDAARAHRLPALVSLADLRGDLHVHTDWSDGRASLVEMAKAARARGYSYIAVTDHSRRIAVTHGLDEQRLARQIEEIDLLNTQFSDFTVLRAIEVDILEDGSLDLPNRILRQLDLVVGAMHAHFDLPADRQTGRLLRAMDNPYLNIIAHPTGRLIGRRAACQLDMERVMRGALARGCFLEVNAQPERLDLDDTHCRLAHELGLKLAISTDAHGVGELDFMRFGVDQARRGWIGAADVLNTRPLAELRALLRS